MRPKGIVMTKWNWNVLLEVIKVRLIGQELRGKQ